MPQRITPTERSRFQAIGQAAGIGFGIAAALILPIVGGLVLDRVTGRAPLFILVGVAVGLIAAGYQLVALSRAAERIPVDAEAMAAIGARRAAEAEARRLAMAEMDARVAAETGGTPRAARNGSDDAGARRRGDEE